MTWFEDLFIDEAKSALNHSCSGGTVPEGGGASSWEDLGSEITQGTVLSESGLTPDPDMGAFLLYEGISIYTGEEYTVNWNGTDYKCICMEIPNGDSVLYALGNLGAMTGGESTGEPFVLFAFPNEADQINAVGYAAAIMPLDGTESLTITVTGKTEVIQELDEKYVKTAISNSEHRMKEYTDNVLSPSIIVSNIDIKLGNNEETLDKEVRASVGATNRPVHLRLTVLGKTYNFYAFPYTDNSKTDIYFSVTFETIEGLYAASGIIYHLRIALLSSGKTFYYLREIHPEEVPSSGV